MLLMRGRDRCWSTRALVAELRASTSLVTDNLKRLEASGLVVRDGEDSVRYGPASLVIDRLASALDQAYRQRPVTIINLIARPDPIQGLADAFKFRGDKG